MTRLVHFTPHSIPSRLAAQVVASAASYLPPAVLKPLVGPLLRGSRSARPGWRQRAADQAISLIVGDGVSQRIRRQHRRRAGGAR
jgi:hypothetical protein